jgi:hypothetical protein
MNELDGLPTVGLKCRDEGGHMWGDPIDTGIDRLDNGAWYYRRYVCQRGCGSTRIRRYSRTWARMSRQTRIQYPEGYVVKGGVDQEALDALRAQDWKASRGRHLRSA